MVGDTALRIVVGTNLCRTVAGRNERLTLRCDFVEILLVFEVEDSRTQLLEGLLGVLQLRFLVLTLHDDTRRDVGQTDCRVGGVHRLTTRARCAEDIFANIVPRHLDVELVCLRKDGNRRSGGVDTTLCLGLRNALHAVHSRLVFERAIYVGTGDLHNHLLITTNGTLREGGNLVTPTLRLDILGVHTHQVAGEQSRLVATRTASNFEHGVLGILRIFRDEQEFDILLHLCDCRL